MCYRMWLSIWIVDNFPQAEIILNITFRSYKLESGDLRDKNNYRRENEI